MQVLRNYELGDMVQMYGTFARVVKSTLELFGWAFNAANGIGYGAGGDTL
ncbi:MAG: hypothetical protein ACYC3A_10440 [Halothiobacillus sp.]